MSRYDPLKKYLSNIAATGKTQEVLSFSQLEGILGFSLCKTAHDNLRWWGNDRTHPQARAWLDAGWEVVHKDLVNKTVTFRTRPATEKAGDTKPSHYAKADGYEEKPVSNRETDISNILVFSPCCSKKRDKRSPSEEKRTPKSYLDKEADQMSLISTREEILCDPKAHRGKRQTYAWDLYVWTGTAYSDLRRSGNAERLRELLAENKLQWFFLSGGYGVVHALEVVNGYQATFDKRNAERKNIKFTGDIWQEAGLSSMLDAIVEKFNPECVYAFGNKDYIRFIANTEFYKKRDKTQLKVFETPYTEKLRQLVEAILSNKVHTFNMRYQEKHCKK